MEYSASPNQTNGSASHLDGKSNTIKDDQLVDAYIIRIDGQMYGGTTSVFTPIDDRTGGTPSSPPLHAKNQID